MRLTGSQDDSNNTDVLTIGVICTLAYAAYSNEYAISCGTHATNPELATAIGDAKATH